MIDDILAKRMARMMAEQIDAEIMRHWGTVSRETTISWGGRVIDGTCRVVEDEPLETEPRRLNASPFINLDQMS